MDGILIGVMALFALVIIVGVAGTILVFMSWKESRLRKLEKELTGCLNIMEDYMVAHDRETGQIWE